MPESPDLLRDAEVLRKLLTECLRRVDRLERQLRIEAESVLKEQVRPALPLADPFEQALPDDEQTSTRGDGLAEVPRRPVVPRNQPPAPRHVPPRPTVQPPPSPRPDPKPEPSSGPPSGPAASHRAPGPLDAFGDADDWEPEPSSGDGLLDPFALLDLSVPPPESHDESVSRAMNDLLGGLDIAPPNDDA